MAIKFSANGTAVHAIPQQTLNQGLQASTIVVAHEQVAVPINSAGDVVITGIAIPANAKIISVECGSTAGSAGTMSIGLYHKAADGTLTLSKVDAFAATIAVTSAVARTERVVIADLGKKAFLAAAHTNADKGTYFLALTFPVANTAAMTVGVKVAFVPA